MEGDIVLISWLINDGDHVDEGDEIVELETSKVTFSVESDKTGNIKFLKEKGHKITIKDSLQPSFGPISAIYKNENGSWNGVTDNRVITSKTIIV